MASPLGPTLANFFLANLENKLLNETNGFYPKLYLRYVDDVFAICDNNLSIKKFLNLLTLKRLSGSLATRAFCFFLTSLEMAG